MFKIIFKNVFSFHSDAKPLLQVDINATCKKIITKTSTETGVTHSKFIVCILAVLNYQIKKRSVVLHTTS